MPEGRDIHRGGTIVLSTALLIVGVALIVRTISGGGGPGALGILLGVLFVAVGVGRLWIVKRTG
jgi:hypothetical protein